MKRLLQISLDQFINYLLIIVLWILLGILVDKNITNIYTITYSIQFIIGLLIVIFGAGPNITAVKMKKEEIIDANIILGMFITFIIILFLIINLDNFLSFLSLNPDAYRDYCFYAFIFMYFQFIIRVVNYKLYFKGENKKANYLTIIFNTINFLSIILLSIFIEEKIIAILITLALDFIIIIFILIISIDKFTFNFQIKNNLKYVSNDIFDYLWLFIIYFVGQKTTFEFGEMFLVAMTFETMITDGQWEMSYAVQTAATIDASKDKLDYYNSLKNAHRLVGMLIISSIIMGLVLYPFYNPPLYVVLIFIFIQFFDLYVAPKLWIKQQYMQINYSARLNTFHTNVSQIIRMFFSFVPTPFCTYLGQMCSALYKIIIYNVYYKNKYYVKNGYLKMHKSKSELVCES